MNNSTPQTSASPVAVPGSEQSASPATATAPVSPPSLPFTQAKGESDRAFEAFRAYLELGPKRRYAAVGRIVGAPLRTVKRWAADFDWRGRVKTCAARSAEQYLETENTLQREALLDAAARARTFRERQYALAEAILAAAERQLELLQEDDLDQMSFADACRALEAASRFTRQTAAPETVSASTPDRALREQLAALLDHVCGQTPARDPAGHPAHSPTPAQPQS